MRMKSCINGICIMWLIVQKINVLLLLPQPSAHWVILNMLIYIFLTLSDGLLFTVSRTNPENVYNNGNMAWMALGTSYHGSIESAWPKLYVVAQTSLIPLLAFLHMTGQSRAFLSPWNPNLYPWIPAFLGHTWMSSTRNIITLNSDPRINLPFE